MVTLVFNLYLDEQKKQKAISTPIMSNNYSKGDEPLNSNNMNDLEIHNA